MKTVSLIAPNDPFDATTGQFSFHAAGEEVRFVRVLVGRTVK
jgi:hypothetical protein